MAENTTASIWRETFRCFGRNWNEWRKSVFWFFVAMLPLCYVVLTESVPYNIKLIQIEREQIQHINDEHYLEAHKDEIQKSYGDLPSMSDGAELAQISLVLVSWIFTYLLYGFFAKRESIVKDAHPGFKGFFYFTCMRILLLVVVILAMIAAMLGVGLCGVTLSIIFHILLPHAASKIMTIIDIACGVIAMWGVLAYVSLRYVLVGVLAAIGANSPFEDSAALTKGKVWRLFCNLLMICIVLVPAMFASVGIVATYGYLIPVSIPMGILMAVAYSVLVVFTLSLGVAFCTTVLRVLWDEKKKTDPAYRLDI